jgi:hypothetical protein
MRKLQLNLIFFFRSVPNDDMCAATTTDKEGSRE